MDKYKSPASLKEPPGKMTTLDCSEKIHSSSKNYCEDIIQAQADVFYFRWPESFTAEGIDRLFRHCVDELDLDCSSHSVEGTTQCTQQ